MLLILSLYFKLAYRYNIIDLPNERSSHAKPTIRGGGIIFPAAILLWGVFFAHSSWPFIIAVALAGLIGFLDDRYSLSPWVRIFVQSAAVGFVIGQAGILTESVIWVVIAFILITGWLNAFNFMDGINGISAFYALSVIFGTWLFADKVPELDLSLIYIVIISLILFSWFNARKKALVFAGDVGSLSMGIILAFLVTILIVTTGRWEFIIMLSVYGVDTVLTIIHRLIKKENIFEAHRTHLYQYLANEMQWNHLAVSFLYALIQFGIILGLYFVEMEYWLIYSISVLVTLGVVYICSKYIILWRLTGIK